MTKTFKFIRSSYCSEWKCTDKENIFGIPRFCSSGVLELVPSLTQKNTVFVEFTDKPTKGFTHIKVKNYFIIKIKGKFIKKIPLTYSGGLFLQEIFGTSNIWFKLVEEK